MVIAPFETTSPITFSVPPLGTEIAVPGVPPQPAVLRAARVGWNKRLLMLLPPVAVTWAVLPFVRMRANWRARLRVPASVKDAPDGPRLDTTWVSVVPSENVHVMVTGEVPGVV